MLKEEEDVYILYYSNSTGSGIRQSFQDLSNDEAYAYAREYTEIQLNNCRTVLYRILLL